MSLRCQWIHPGLFMSNTLFDPDLVTLTWLKSFNQLFALVILWSSTWKDPKPLSTYKHCQKLLLPACINKCVWVMFFFLVILVVWLLQRLKILLKKGFCHLSTSCSISRFAPFARRSKHKQSEAGWSGIKIAITVLQQAAPPFKDSEEPFTFWECKVWR